MKALVILSHHDHHFFHLHVYMEKMNCTDFWSIFFRKNTLQITHANHMTMTTTGQIWSWPDYRKTIENMNITLLDL